MIKEAINALVNGKDLTDEVMTQVMEEIMTGEATDAQKASFLTALSIKGETIDEITAAAKVMSSKCTPFNNEGDALEIVGTGGDKANSFNISTIEALFKAISFSSFCQRKILRPPWDRAKARPWLRHRHAAPPSVRGSGRWAPVRSR